MRPALIYIKRRVKNKLVQINIFYNRLRNYNIYRNFFADTQQVKSLSIIVESTL